MCDSQKKTTSDKVVKVISEKNRSTRSSVFRKTVADYLKLCYKTNGKRLSVHYRVIDALVGRLAKHERS